MRISVDGKDLRLKEGLYWYIHIRENTEQIFVGIRTFYKETDKQEIIFAMDLSEHSGFTPFTRELTLPNAGSEDLGRLLKNTPLYKSQQ